MAEIFDGLEKFGLTGYAKAELFAPDGTKNNAGEKPAKPFNIKDYIYTKELTCPVCGVNFGANFVRMGRLRLLTIEYDLRPVYEPLDPLFHDVIICEKCGYGAVRQQFTSVTDSQADLVRQQLSPKYKPCAYPDELTADMAVERYKLVLLNALIKKARYGEKAYICMKLAWLYRIKGDKANELLFTRHAYEGFSKAYEDDKPPIMGLEEDTLVYLLGAFSKVLGIYDDSLRYLGKIIVSPSASHRLKDRARDLKGEIRDLKKE